MELYSAKKHNLPLPQYQRWYDAIVNDDILTIKHYLNTSSTEEKYRLLNGRFGTTRDMDKDLMDTKNFGHKCLEKLNAFSLATAYEVSEEILVEFIQNGADLSL